MSGSKDPIRRALSGFSLHTLGDEQRWGSSVAIPGKEIERYEVGPASVVIANEGDVGRYSVIEPPLTEREKERQSRSLSPAWRRSEKGKSWLTLPMVTRLRAPCKCFRIRRLAL